MVKSRRSSGLMSLMSAMRALKPSNSKIIQLDKSSKPAQVPPNNLRCLSASMPNSGAAFSPHRPLMQRHKVSKIVIDEWLRKCQDDAKRSCDLQPERPRTKFQIEIMLGIQPLSDLSQAKHGELKGVARAADITQRSQDENSPQPPCSGSVLENEPPGPQ